MPSQEQRAEAWIGDGVLGLYARRRILEAKGRMDGDLFARMTSNQFLSAFGDPTLVEARIGRIYETESLEAAFHWIETQLMPLFDRQERNRRT